ncbi:MAG: class I SAM-dependent methyltransferase [Paracoccaceae bacterium]
MSADDPQTGTDGKAPRGFFDFLAGRERAGAPDAVNRMNLRHEALIAPHAGLIRDARVLDLASHDGRWPYAFAGAGAREVVGVEARPELAAEFESYPDADLKARVEMRVNDLYAELEVMAEAGERFDVVGVFGIFYHVMDHYRMLRLIRRLGPKLVVVDSEFVLRPGPVVLLLYEDPEKQLNTIRLAEGQTRTPKGVPSLKAMEMMAESLAWSVDWFDWDGVPEARRSGVADYYRGERMRRATCALRPA